MSKINTRAVELTYGDMSRRVIGVDWGFCREAKPPVPKEVIFNNPYTIVNWKDGTKTVVKCMEGDEFSKDAGFAIALARKVYGRKYGRNVYQRYIKKASVQNE